MKKINRREALQKGGRLLMGAAAGVALTPFATGCSNEDALVAVAENLRQRIEPMEIEKLKISIVYDNYRHRKGIKADWGFSCLVEGMDRTILFDTGRYDDILMDNMSAMGVKAGQADIIFLSHEHPDHVGGLHTFLDHRTVAKVFKGRSMSSGVTRKAAEKGSEIVAVDNPVLVTRNSVSSGEMKSFVKNEHSLFIDTTNGVVVITGCAHPGIVDIVQRARKLLRKEVLLVMGGFHLLMDSEGSIRDIAERLKGLDIRYVMPIHCSGSLAQKIFKDVYGDHYLEGGVGRIITAADLPTEKQQLIS